MAGAMNAQPSRAGGPPASDVSPAVGLVGLAGLAAWIALCRNWPWLADALHAIGRKDEARALFEALLARRNHVGLLSEDIDPITGRLWGNFPQTYSMVGIIVTAMRLSREWVH